MKNPLSFMGANFVAREIGYKMTDGWGQGDIATQDRFRPIDTFEDRFDAMLGEIAELGFDAMDMWTGHLHYTWATPEHVAIARRLLAKHKLRVVSYAGGFGLNMAQFRSACRICSELNIPVLGGGTGLLTSHRAEVVATLHEFGLIFGYENHPEKSIDEILAKLGEGDEDVIGVALDTGWLATGKVDVIAALRVLAPRLKHLHLKDVKAPREEKSGYTFIDIGHETCRLGDGIVPVEACVKLLPELGYTGVISIEHEPEEFDPREDVRASAEAIRSWQKSTPAVSGRTPVRVAIVGCGNIAGPYARDVAPYPEVEIVGAQDMERSRAVAFVEKNGGRVYETLDEVIADPNVDVVVNLTIHHAHVEVITRCLEGGKHVHSEKPIAMSYAEAKRLVDLAAEKNLRLSCAPITWMGEAQQTAWKLVRDGAIGTPRVAYAEVNWGRIESWHPNPGPFYEVGPIFDVAVYPLTLLTTWFGPAKRVIASGGVVYPNRVTKEGNSFTIDTPEWACAIVELASGVRARVTASFYVGWNTRQKGLEVHGDKAMVALDRWDVFNSPVWFGELQARDGLTHIPLVKPALPVIEFGRGVVELAQAIQENRPHRAQGAHAAHVVEIMEAIQACVKNGHPRDLTSTFEPPAPMEWAE